MSRNNRWMQDVRCRAHLHAHRAQVYDMVHYEATPNGPRAGPDRALAHRGGLPAQSKTPANFLYEELRLLECGKVPALWHLVPIVYVRVSTLDPFARRLRQLLRE